MKHLPGMITPGSASSQWKTQLPWPRNTLIAAVAFQKKHLAYQLTLMSWKSSILTSWLPATSRCTYIHLILIIYRISTAALDEYAQYCLLSQHHDFDDIRKWWIEERQKRDFPNLSRMALDMLSIPAMAADPERLFSSAGLTVTDRRNNLSIQSIEELECIKSRTKL
jgi:hypothetical protein